MSILTKNQILKRIDEGSITIHPSLDLFQIQGHAIDLRLGYTFMIPKLWEITSQGRVGLPLADLDISGADSFDIVELEKSQYFDLLPGEYILASTLEEVGLPDDLLAVLYPRSSTNRKGLSVDLTGIIDAGYKGQLIIPIKNNNSSRIIRLYPGERLCQIVFNELGEHIELRSSKYHLKDVIEGVKKEKTEEVEKIKDGSILELKKDFPV